jgi:hypothetical protein
MKLEILKKLIKESVKEAINEELKEILLEAVKSSKNDSTSFIKESLDLSNSPNKKMLMEKYFNSLDETFTTNSIPTNAVPYKPMASSDPVNGTLPPGELSMEQIFGLMKR